MVSLGDLRDLLAAGQTPGILYLESIELSSVPRSAEEQGIPASELAHLREAELALRVMALANGYSTWGNERHILVGVSPDGDLVGYDEASLDNARLQRIVRRHCSPQPICFLQSFRLRGHRVGVLQISDTARKPYSFAKEICYSQRGEELTAYHQGQVWVQKGEFAELASHDEIVQIQFDAALVRNHPSAGALASTARRDTSIDPAALARLVDGAVRKCALEPTALGPGSAQQLAEIARASRMLLLSAPAGYDADHLLRSVASALGDDIRYAAATVEPAMLAATLGRIRDCIVLMPDTSPMALQPMLAILPTLLEENSLFLLASTTAPAIEWEMPSEYRTSLVDAEEGEFYSKDELVALLDSALGDENRSAVSRCLSTSAKVREQAYGGLAHTLGSPGAIARFADRVRTIASPHKDKVHELARQASNLGRDLLSWFWNLNHHERYFALAAGILQDLPAERFWPAYETLVEEAWRPHDPTLRTIPGVNAELAAQITPAPSFAQTGAADIILAEAMSRYRRPLVWAAATVGDLIGELDAPSAAEALRTERIAATIAALGADDTASILPILRGWAGHRNAGVRFAAAQTLAALWQCDERCADQALEVIEAWAKNSGVEEGWTAPRHAYRPRTAAAHALGLIAWSSPAEGVGPILDALWRLADDSDPRVRAAVAQSLGSAGSPKLAHSMGLLGHLASDPSKRVRSHVAGAIAAACTPWPSATEVLQSWAHETSGGRPWTSRLALLLGSGSNAQAGRALAVLAGLTGELAGLSEITREMAPAMASFPGDLERTLNTLADHDSVELGTLALAGLLAWAKTPGGTLRAERLVTSWQEEDRARRDIAARYQEAWDESLLIGAPTIAAPLAQPSAPIAEFDLDDEMDEAATEAMGQPAATRGPKRWMRRGPTAADLRAERRTKTISTIWRLTTAAGIAALTAAVLTSLPYYDREWRPVLALVAFALAWYRPGLGALAGGLISVLPLLYQSPTLVIWLAAYGAALMGLGGPLGTEHRATKRMLVLAFPLVVQTPIALLLPFLAGWAFRKRAPWLIAWGLVLTIIVGVVMGQPLVGEHLGVGIASGESWLLNRAEPVQWQSLGWLLDLGQLKEGASGAIAVAKSLALALTNSPFVLVQIALWALISWIVGWAVDQADRRVGIGGVLAAALIMIGVYRVVLTSVLGWLLPFDPDAVLSARILAGAAIVLLGRHVWPLFQAWQAKVRLWERARGYIIVGAKAANEWIGKGVAAAAKQVSSLRK